MNAPMDSVSPRGGIVRGARRPPGWVAPGPTPPSPSEATDLWPGPDEDLCWLAGNWRILQRLDGHRFSLDDLLTAHFASEATAVAPARVLDLGCGIGSVLLFVAWRHAGARCVGVEAQQVSAALARRSIAWNGAAQRVCVAEGDFRDPRILAGQAPFDLITGTPPYFPIGTGVESDGIQRGPCRFEHRGGVEAYCAAAARVLAPGAPLVLCEAFAQRHRVSGAAAASGLVIELGRDVVPRAGKQPLFTLFRLRQAAHALPSVSEPPLVVRDAAGRRTEEFVAVRAAMGMPP